LSHFYKPPKIYTIILVIKETRMETVSAAYRLKDWKEASVFERSDGVKVTRVDAEFNYEGELAGATRVAYLMFYAADGSGSYSGWERFSGTFRGRPAETVVAQEGTFTPEAVEVQAKTVAGTGTGALDGVALRYVARFLGHGPYQLSIAVE
jgi:hypothetical protein